MPYYSFFRICVGSEVHPRWRNGDVQSRMVMGCHYTRHLKRSEMASIIRRAIKEEVSPIAKLGYWRVRCHSPREVFRFKVVD